jgi:hypothetical protein
VLSPWSQDAQYEKLRTNKGSGQGSKSEDSHVWWRMASDMAKDEDGELHSILVVPPE